MNKIVLIGNLTRNPEMRVTQSGVDVCSFTIAVDRKFAVNGNKVTDFFRINAWRQLGESCGRYLEKGKKVAVVGELQARQYEAKDGSTKMTLDVQADEVEFLSPKSERHEQNASNDSEGFAGFTDIDTSDIPFN